MAKIKNTESNTLVNGTSGNDSIRNKSGGTNVTINAGNGDDTILNGGPDTREDLGDDYVTINGGAGNDSIQSWGSYVSVYGGEGNDTIESAFTAVYVTLNGGKGNDYISNPSDNASIVGGSGADTIVLYVNGTQINSTINGGEDNDIIRLRSSASLNVIQYKSGDGNDKIYGLKSTDTLSISGGSYSTTKSGKNIIVTVDDGKISLIGAADYFSDDNIDFTKTTPANSWKLDGTTATYGTSSKTLVTVTGVKSLDGLSISGKVVTVKAASLGTSKVTVSDGYTLKLGDDVSAPSTSNKWTISGTTAKYNQTTAGYALASDSKSISYSASSSKTLATVSGVKSLDGLSISGKVVTVKKASLGTSKVTISGTGYTLKLGSDVSASSTSNAWTISGTTAKYNQTTAAGYSLANDSKSINYSDSSSKTLATVKGVKSLDGLSISGKVVTVKKASLGTSKVTISGTGYTLKLGSDVSASSTKKAAFSLSGSTATYKSSYKTAGYTLASDGKSIAYTKATTAESLATIKGAASKTGLSVSGNTITLKKSALKNKVTVSGGYEFDFASDYKKATISGSSSGDTITTRGSNLSINGGKGNDTIKALGTSTTITGGAGADVFIYKAGQSGVITDYAAEDKISIASGTAKVTTSGSNVIFAVGSGKITIKGGKDKTITYSDTSGKNKTYKYEEEPVEDDKSVKLSEDYEKLTYVMEGKTQTLDASDVQFGLKITGNIKKSNIIGSTENDTINGGGASDTIDGGAGNDIINGGTGNDSLTGGKGADTFIYNAGDGDDVISDYAEEDLISVKGGTVKVTASSNDIIFSVGNGKITVAGGADKIISYVDNKGTHSYSHYVKFNDKGTSATLKSNYPNNKSFEPSNYGKYVYDLATIDASDVQHRMNIVGNELANSIFGTADEDTIDGGTNNDIIRGGDGNDSLYGNDGRDTLYGGEGNDTLWGGKGNDNLYGGGDANDSDVFIYNNGDGNDRIFDYNVSLDRIIILSGQADNVAEKDNDIIFTIGTGKIILDGMAGKHAKVEDSSGHILKEIN